MEYSVKVRIDILEKRKVSPPFRLPNDVRPDCSPGSIYTELRWLQIKFTYIFIFHC